jgi:hypothetical protein
MHNPCTTHMHGGGGRPRASERQLLQLVKAAGGAYTRSSSEIVGGDYGRACAFQWSFLPDDLRAEPEGAAGGGRDGPGLGQPRGGAGAGGRDLCLALHAEDHRAGGLRLCLDARHGRRRRRIRQARDRRRARGLGHVRAGDRRRPGRGADRGASRRLHRRPAALLGGGARGQQDLRLRRRERPGEPGARADDRRLRGDLGRGGGAARRLCAARADADPGAVEQGRQRADGARGVFQRRRLDRDALAADQGERGRHARCRIRRRLRL